MRCFLAVFSLCVLVTAQDGPAPPIFFRTPDKDTEKRIDDLMSHKGLGSGTRKVRTDARRELRDIGIWTVPFLCNAISGKRKVKIGRIPMNATMTLGRILDPFCLDVLRTAATTDRGKKQHHLRQTACLVIGLFDASTEDLGKNVDTLTAVLEERGDRRVYHCAAALGLGKIKDKRATSRLVAMLAELPKDPYYAAAAIVGASVRSRDAQPERFLDRKNEEIVRRAAATCLTIRPMPSEHAPVLIKWLNDGTKDRRVRPLVYYALAAMPRTDAIRAALLKGATRGGERDEARVAALIGLSYEWNVRSNYKAIKRAVKKGRNDRVVAAALFALAQTGAPQAVDDLIGVMRSGSARSRFYAAGSLMYMVTLANPSRLHKDDAKIRDAIADLRRAQDAALKDFDLFRGAALVTTDLKKRAETARTWFKDMRDPYGLNLWSWTQEDRSWALVNKLLPAIFDLDDIADKSDFDNPNKVGDQPLATPGKSGGRELQGTPEEQDLLDFLAERPYFGAEDLGER